VVKHFHLDNTPALSLSTSNRLRHASLTLTIFVEASTLHCKTALLFTAIPFHFSLQDRSTLHCRTVPLVPARPFPSTLQDPSTRHGGAVPVFTTRSLQSSLQDRFTHPCRTVQLHASEQVLIKMSSLAITNYHPGSGMFTSFAAHPALYSSRPTNSDRLCRPEVPVIKE